MNQPQRAFQIEIKIGADTKQHTMSLLYEFVKDIFDDGVSCVSVGPSSGGFHTVKKNPEMTHERYIEELDAWLD